TTIALVGTIRNRDLTTQAVNGLARADTIRAQVAAGTYQQGRQAGIDVIASGALLREGVQAVTRREGNNSFHISFARGLDLQRFERKFTGALVTDTDHLTGTSTTSMEGNIVEGGVSRRVSGSI